MSVTQVQLNDAIKRLPEKYREPTRKAIRCEGDKKAVLNGYYFDQQAADFVITFFSQVLYLEPEKKFTPLEWQEEVLRSLFGWKGPDGLRRFKTGYVSIGKKNGKSPLGGGIPIFMLLADGEYNPHIYNCAYNSKQAKIVYDYMAQIIRNSPKLAAILEPIDSTKRIIPKNGAKLNGQPVTGLIQALARDHNAADGINAHCVIFDELHRQRTRDMWDTLRYATEAKKQPLLLAITTAGTDKNGVCFEQYEYAKCCRDGLIDDPSYYCYIAESALDDPPDSVETWYKANPALGTVLTLDRFRQAYLEAKTSELKMRAFRRFRLNQWVEGDDLQWLPIEAWDACKGEMTFQQLEKYLEGKECYAALDMARSNDLAALVLLFPIEEDGTEKYYVLPYFWVPALTDEDLITKQQKDRASYLSWRNGGFIEHVKGPIITDKVVLDKIADLAATYNIKNIAADPFQTSQILAALEADFEIYKFSQHARVFNPAVQELEKYVLNQALVHGGHPVLRYMANNTILEESQGQYYKPSKRKSTNKIDGIVALTMAVGGVVSREEKAEVEIDWSFYNSINRRKG